MKILIYGINYAPELTGIGKYTGEMVAWLAKRGHDIRVVTTPPYYPAWCIADGYRNKFSREASVNVAIYRCPLYVPPRPNGIKRVAHLASFMATSLPVVLKQIWWQPDVVWTVEPTFFSAPGALLAACGSGAASWLHVQDFEVDAAFDLGLLPSKGAIHALALALERVFTRSFDRVSSISHNMVQRLLDKGIPAASASLFPNWVDVNAVESHTPGLNTNSFRRELGLGSKIILLYSGNMGAKQGLESLAPLARAFAHDDGVHFLLCGDGAFRAQLEKLVTGLVNVTMLPLQPLHRFNDLLNAADIHLLPQRGGAADLVMPSKLTGILASGRPVIATADSGTQVAYVVGGVNGAPACGLVIPAENQPALHEAVQRLISDPQMRRKLGASARKYATEHLGKEQVLLKFEADLKRLAYHRV